MTNDGPFSLLGEPGLRNVCLGREQT
jgi:hypothetical protein